MEMHTSRSLYATHAIMVRRRPRTRWIEPVLTVLSRMKRALQRELEIRRAEAELKTLSDHLLKDLGISRSDIERVVRGKPPALDRRSQDAPC